MQATHFFHHAWIIVIICSLMPTYWTRTLIPTARQVPADAQIGAGVYDYLPLGLRALQKVMAIIREEMDRAGAVEVMLPALQPIELWEQTGRDVAYGENLFVLKDRHSRKLALGPTHEEVITELARGYVESYRQLPLTLYQIQTKFRDEYRPRFGVLRSREFQMKDAYSFHLKLEGPPGSGSLDETYQKQYDAYCRIFERCGLPYRVVEAESGPIGGSASHEFMVPSPTGEDTILESDKGNYAANVEKCEIGERAANLHGQAKGELEKLHTPDCPGIEDVVDFFKKKLGSKLRTANMLKTLVCRTTDRWIIAVVRGDHDLNESKLKAACSAPELQLADEREAQQAGFAIGFVGPQIVAERNDVTLYIDPDAAQDSFWVTGANEVDHHVKSFNWQRDVLDKVSADRLHIADIRNAVDGDPSPKNDGGVLRTTRGIEIGHVFKLGDKYTRALDFTVLDENNQRAGVLMGCYGIGVNRIVASAIEKEYGHDANGIIWPASIAPYAVIITTIKYEGAQKETACGLAQQLEAQNLDVLIDDRDERPGVKFKDADLIGIPVRITIGDKALAEGKVEIKARTAGKAEPVPVDDAAEHVLRLLQSM